MICRWKVITNSHLTLRVYVQAVTSQALQQRNEHQIGDMTRRLRRLCEGERLGSRSDRLRHWYQAGLLEVCWQKVLSEVSVVGLIEINISHSIVKGRIIASLN